MADLFFTPQAKTVATEAMNNISPNVHDNSDNKLSISDNF